jgi:hypothetical protein
LDGVLDATVPRVWTPTDGIDSLARVTIQPNFDLAEVTAHGVGFDNATAIAYMKNYWRPRWRTW